ncbi:hypothetical protein [Microbacterium sp. LMI1-1-1.1]|uniref:hypothetical protein n=1 Tax=Microbacterium sp. LMI1-1-1.1 TaxID=3135223 RepID=UPI0034670AC8
MASLVIRVAVSQPINASCTEKRRVRAFIGAESVYRRGAGGGRDAGRADVAYDEEVACFGA